MHNIKFLLLLIGWSILFSCSNPDPKTPVPDANYVLIKGELLNKIKGGWAGQVIGCTYGGPTEFKFNGTLIQDYQRIEWNEDSCLWWYENVPGLYDDIYMDLTFVEIIEKKGIEASAMEHAEAFAYADYPLWHANQAARNNIINNIMPPQSGHWKYNPHADDIDFQIEADFAGLMSPGLVNKASEICDKVGHIMNYGDGWYGGVFVAAMYSNAFIYDDIELLITESLKAIPAESSFHKCISDVVEWWKKYPDDWKQTWFEVQKKWSEDVGCPDGVFSSFNIDAKINAAYAAIGLLYGEKDYSKTLEISTRCGNDSDCNPATAGGILGTIIGYDSIPELWKKPLYKVEDMKFEYTTWSLNDVYQVGYEHALKNLKSNGGVFKDSTIELPRVQTKTVPLEIGWKNMVPVSKKNQDKELNAENTSHSFSFEGTGFLLKGFARSFDQNVLPHHIFEIQVLVDNVEQEPIMMTTDVLRRRLDICWNYDLEPGQHDVTISITNPNGDCSLLVGDLIVYQPKNK